MLMIRILLSAFLLASLSLGAAAQTPLPSDLHKPTSFDNSYAGTLPVGGWNRSGDERYGFNAIFELRVAPGIVKVLDVRQYFASEQQAVQGFLRVRTAMPEGAYLVSVQWTGPTQGQANIGQ